MRSGTISLTAECTSHSVLTAKLSPLFTQAGSGKASDCVKAPCLWSPSLSTVGYADFLKSTAQRLGPTVQFSDGCHSFTLQVNWTPSAAIGC